jgi:hypothetical protein
MRPKHFVALLALCVVAQGCNSFKKVTCVGTGNSVASIPPRPEVRPTWLTDDVAKTAWVRFAAEFPDCQDSEDFAKGFKAGFMDYMRGQAGSEPAMSGQSARGATDPAQAQQTAAEWARGYRHGSTVAREGGYRDGAVVSKTSPMEQYTAPVTKWSEPEQPVVYIDEPPPAVK